MPQIESKEEIARAKAAEEWRHWCLQAQEERDECERQLGHLLKAIEKTRLTALGSLRNHKARGALYAMAAEIQAEREESENA